MNKRTLHNPNFISFLQIGLRFQISPHLGPLATCNPGLYGNIAQLAFLKQVIRNLNNKMTESTDKQIQREGCYGEKATQAKQSFLFHS